ncbi:proprotein convertase P-domain-containing protein [Sphingopyxis terrae]|uniref:Conserved repeat domain-containing protein n=1 Tax=Sphingopyxis terrae subsp. ummariensis TaxID=429001 RepID=A0A1Y6FXM8_9SPHN|nr:proprotein convertase P-domain-containing protein [Sphingopyxis terrae]PCF90532.1 proprotein convertase, P [Sphingopyxis terrae subsp. ummariensis]SMQ77313.1 conserved repeat domain-containing protein [Sphingopyxis terrae subsp. ummariensis]
MLLWLAMALVVAPAARAQTTTTYSNTTGGAISNGTPCSSPLVRNFTVSTSYIVGDVDLGVLATHTWRGDLRITLQSPAGTRVQLVNGDTNNISGDNFNVRLNDGGAQTVNTDGNTVTHSISAPPYQNDFSPNSPLSAFNGENAQGTWRLEICDQYPQADNGNFVRADLYLTSLPANYADLSLTKSVSSAAPATGSSISYTLAVTNASGSPATATGVTVLDTLPAGFSFTSATGFGSYNSTTGVWTVGSVPPGATRTLTISGTVNATSGATILNSAEITASSAPDIDSTPGNGATGEDDYAAASFTVSGSRVAGVPPVLICPAGSTLHDWDSVSWSAGTTSGSYALTAIGTMNVNIAISGGSFLSNATYGGQSPTRQNVVTGGLSPAQYSIFEIVDFTSQAGVVTSTISLPTAVPGAQFTLFDIDYASGQFADRVTVTGSFNGTIVYPTLTNGVANYVVGNSAYGDATSADGSANGNVVVTFAAPVDTITIEYGSHSLAPANPGQQGMAIHDINFCRPVANLLIAKTSSIVSDPVNGTTNPKAIPGATMRYCLLVTNGGSATATAIYVADPLPATTSFVPGSLRSGTSCAGATTGEDDNATGADESDPFGAAIAGTTVSASTAALGPGSAFATVFDVTVN